MAQKILLSADVTPEAWTAWTPTITAGTGTFTTVLRYWSLYSNRQNRSLSSINYHHDCRNGYRV